MLPLGQHSGGGVAVSEDLCADPAREPAGAGGRGLLGQVGQCLLGRALLRCDQGDDGVQVGTDLDIPLGEEGCPVFGQPAAVEWQDQVRDSLDIVLPQRPEVLSEGQLDAGLGNGKPLRGTLVAVVLKQGESPLETDRDPVGGHRGPLAGFACDVTEGQGSGVQLIDELPQTQRVEGRGADDPGEAARPPGQVVGVEQGDRLAGTFGGCGEQARDEVCRVYPGLRTDDGIDRACGGQDEQRVRPAGSLWAGASARAAREWSWPWTASTRANARRCASARASTVARSQAGLVG